MPHIQLLDSHCKAERRRNLNTHIIINNETGKLIASNLKFADTFWTRLRGLVATDDLVKGQGLLLTPCTSVHTILMKHPIDIAYLDPQLKVLAVYPNVRPWRILRGVKGTKHVLEIPTNTLTATGTLVGHKLAIAQAT